MLIVRAIVSFIHSLSDESWLNLVKIARNVRDVNFHFHFHFFAQV